MSKNMLNILINAYAVAPNWGSEQGVGWNWIINIAKYCRCFVITEGEWRKEIEEAVEKLPQRDNIKFYYNPVPEKVRKMCWNQGDWRFYYYYQKWQKRTLKIAQEICSKEKIDVIHQLNMVGFREPGYLWKIKNIPFVWGPVGGMANMPMKFLKKSNWKLILFSRIKNTINTLQYKYHPRVRKTIKRADALIAAVEEVQRIFKDIHRKDSILINETGCNLVSFPKTQKNNEELNLIWVGKFDFRKQLEIALQTISKIKQLNITLHICGGGSEKQVKHYKQLSKKLEIENKCIWHGNLEHDKTLELMQKADVFFFTSIMDLTSTVVLEAIQNKLPIVCHDTCGFGCIVNNTIGRKVDLVSPEYSETEFAKIISDFYYNRELLSDMSNNFDEIAKKLTYEYKAEKVLEIYTELSKKKREYKKG